jgi:hypothetical protein
MYKIMKQGMLAVCFFVLDNQSWLSILLFKAE